MSGNSNVLIDRSREFMWRNKLSKEQEVLYDEILETIAGQTVKEIYTCLDSKSLTFVFKAIDRDYPEYGFYWNHDLCVFERRGGYKIKIQYRYSAEMVREKLHKINRYIEENIMPYVYWKRCNTDKEIVAAVYEYLARRVTYSKKRDDGTYPHCAYTIETLLNQVGVCQGVSLSMQYILRQYQIDCLYISGYTSGDVIKHPDDSTHGWLLVRLDGRFYHLDLTWDLNKNGFDYFLLNDREIRAKDHRWNAKRFPKAG